MFPLQWAKEQNLLWSFQSVFKNNGCLALPAILMLIIQAIRGKDGLGFKIICEVYHIFSELPIYR